MPLFYNSFFIVLYGIAQRLMEVRLKRQCNKLWQQISFAPDEYLIFFSLLYSIVVISSSTTNNNYFDEKNKIDFLFVLKDFENYGDEKIGRIS